MLTPLSLWAGTLMTTARPGPARAVTMPSMQTRLHHQAQLLAHDLPHMANTQPTKPTHASAHARAHDCTNADDLHTARLGPNEGQLAVADDACHEGLGCTVCGGCHLCAGLLHNGACPSSKAV